MNDIEIIQELKLKISLLEEENKLLKKFVDMVESGNVSSQSVVRWTKKEEKFKNIDWSELDD